MVSAHTIGALTHTHWITTANISFSRLSVRLEARRTRTCNSAESNSLSTTLRDLGLCKDSTTSQLVMVNWAHQADLPDYYRPGKSTIQEMNQW